MAVGRRPWWVFLRPTGAGWGGTSAIRRFWSRMRSEGRNPRYLSDLEYDPSVIAPSDDLDAVVRDAEVVILATPSAYLKEILSPLTVSLKEKFIVSAIKGIVPGGLPDGRGVYPRPLRTLLQTVGAFTGTFARRGGLARETLLPDGGVHGPGECPPDRFALCPGGTSA